MRYPKFLPENGTIGFIAPAFGCNREPYKSAFQNALRVWEEKGYHTVLGPNCYAGNGIGISNTPELCAKEIEEFYDSNRCDILLSCGGGELMCEDLDHLDLSRLREAEPKWFMGYSDNTNLSFLLATGCDVAAVYGPNAPAFGMHPWHPSLEDSLNVLTGRSWHICGYDLFERESLKNEEHPLEPYNITEPCLRRAYPEGDHSITGRLLGGCMDCLSNLVGTRFDHVKSFNDRYRQDGIIWFLEACDLSVLGIRRALWQMKNAGWFDHTKGFLIGRPYCHGQEIMGLDQYQAVTDMLGDFHVPILMDLDIGHIPPMMPLVVGSMATVTMTGNDISIDMRAE